MKVLSKKELLTKVERFQMSFLDLSQTCETAFTETVKFGTFRDLFGLYLRQKVLTGSQALRKNNGVEVWRRLERVKGKKMLTLTIPEKINETKYPSESGKDQKTLISACL